MTGVRFPVDRSPEDADCEPIGWLDWSPAAFDRARREQRPILLAVTASWSAACRAMNASTYANPAVARMIGERMVPVRVDSDRRPDLNERYNLGGWPTTVCLTPDGEILTGGTYFESEALMDLIVRTSDSFRARPSTFDSRPAPGPVDEPQPIDFTAERWVADWLVDRFDPKYGTFDAEPNAPRFSALHLLLERCRDGAAPALTPQLAHAVDVVRNSDLYDWSAGGFFRYTRHSNWTEPQPEKLLVDQAAWIELLLEAAAVLERDDFRLKALDLIRWLHRDLADRDEGGFHASVCCEDVASESADDAPQPLLPSTDRTILVDWNTDMAAGYLRASQAFDDSAMRDFGLLSLERVLLMHYRPGDGVAHCQDGRASVRGLLADQVHAARALMFAAELTGQEPHLMLAEELMGYACRTMWDDRRGGFFDHRAPDDSAEEQGLLRCRFKPFGDNCLASRVLLRLSVLADKAEYCARARRTLESVTGPAKSAGFEAADYALAVRDLRLSGALP